MKTCTRKTIRKNPPEPARRIIWPDFNAAGFAALSPELTIISLKDENARLRRIIKELSELL